MKCYAAPVLLLATAVWNPHADTLSGREVAIADGDTVMVLSAQHRQFKVRLSGIGAPEKKQPFGKYAQDQLAQHLSGQSVVVDWSKTDRYGHIVRKIEAGGLDVNREQVRADSAGGLHPVPARTCPGGPRAPRCGYISPPPAEDREITECNTDCQRAALATPIASAARADANCLIQINSIAD